MDNNITVEGILGKQETSTSSSEKETTSSTNESIIFKTTSEDLPKGNETVSDVLSFIGIGLLFTLALLLFASLKKTKEPTNQ